MTNQAKTPGAMVLVPREKLGAAVNGSRREHSQAIYDLRLILREHAEQPPAVGGEPEIFKWTTNGMVIDPEYAAYSKKAFVRLSVVAPLLAERDQFSRMYDSASGALCAIGEALGVDEADQSTDLSLEAIQGLKARIAELEAAQGEAVAVMYEDGSVLTKTDCIDDSVFAICCKVQTPLYRQAQPATAKVVLPERMEVYSAIDTGWNLCLDQVAKLNGGA